MKDLFYEVDATENKIIKTFSYSTFYYLEEEERALLYRRVFTGQSKLYCGCRGDAIPFDESLELGIKKNYVIYSKKYKNQDMHDPECPKNEVYLNRKSLHNLWERARIEALHDESQNGLIEIAVNCKFYPAGTSVESDSLRREPVRAIKEPMQKISFNDFLYNLVVDNWNLYTDRNKNTAYCKYPDAVKALNLIWNLAASIAIKRRSGGAYVLQDLWVDLTKPDLVLAKNKPSFELVHCRSKDFSVVDDDIVFTGEVKYQRHMEVQRKFPFRIKKEVWLTMMETCHIKTGEFYIGGFFHRDATYYNSFRFHSAAIIPITSYGAPARQLTTQQLMESVADDGFAFKVPQAERADYADSVPKLYMQRFPKAVERGKRKEVFVDIFTETDEEKELRELKEAAAGAETRTYDLRAWYPNRRQPIPNKATITKWLW